MIENVLENTLDMNGFMKYMEMTLTCFKKIGAVEMAQASSPRRKQRAVLPLPQDEDHSPCGQDQALRTQVEARRRRVD